MGYPHRLNERPQTLGEEIANSITHGLALLAILIAAPFLVMSVASKGDSGDIAGAVVFSVTMVLVYGTSTFYHSIPFGRTKQFFRIVDHSVIYLLIAGTYTPFALGALEDSWGIALLTVQWVLAITGVSLKVFTGLRYKKLSIILYLVMGWLALVAVKPLIANVPLNGLVWILAGGIAYTAGIPFYTAKKVKYTHLVWHLFVIAGTFCHFVAVMWYSG